MKWIYLLKNSLQIFCESENSSTLTKSNIFLLLSTINIKELRQIVSRLSQNKAIAEIFEDAILWKQIFNKNDDKMAKIFIHFFGTQKSLIQILRKISYRKISTKF